MKQPNQCCSHKIQKPASPTFCFAHTTSNQPPTAHRGLALIGDQYQTVIQPYTRPEKLVKASYTVNSHLTWPCTSNPPSPPFCYFHTTQSHPPTVRTVPGVFHKAALTARPRNFGRSKWLEHGRRPCSSENSAATFEQIRSVCFWASPFTAFAAPEALYLLRHNCNFSSKFNGYCNSSV